MLAYLADISGGAGNILHGQALSPRGVGRLANPGKNPAMFADLLKDTP
jgi:hypothetical protein